MTADYDGRAGHWSVERGFARECLGVHQAYWLLPGSFSGLKNIRGPFFASFAGGWQYSNAANLPPSQLFQLGGAGTIPGYPVGTAAGVKGFYDRAAFNARLKHHMSLGAGYNYGVVYATFPARTELQSVDLALQGRFLRFHAMEPLSWRADAAHPLRTVLPDQSAWTVYCNIVAPFDL